MQDRGRKSTSPDSLDSISMEEDGFSTTSESINDVNGNDLEVICVFLHEVFFI